MPPPLCLSRSEGLLGGGRWFIKTTRTFPSGRTGAFIRIVRDPAEYAICLAQIDEYRRRQFYHKAKEESKDMQRSLGIHLGDGDGDGVVDFTRPNVAVKVEAEPEPEEEKQVRPPAQLVGHVSLQGPGRLIEGLRVMEMFTKDGAHHCYRVSISRADQRLLNLPVHVLLSPSGDVLDAGWRVTTARAVSAGVTVASFDEQLGLTAESYFRAKMARNDRGLGRVTVSYRNPDDGETVQVRFLPICEKKQTNGRHHMYRINLPKEHWQKLELEHGQVNVRPKGDLLDGHWHVTTRKAGMLRIVHADPQARFVAQEYLADRDHGFGFVDLRYRYGTTHVIIVVRGLRLQREKKADGRCYYFARLPVAHARIAGIVTPSGKSPKIYLHPHGNWAMPSWIEAPSKHGVQLHRYDTEAMMLSMEVQGFVRQALPHELRPGRCN